MSRKYLIRITELERLLSEQAEALRQRDLQLSLVEETEAFLRSALARAEEKIEEEEREIEYLRAQIEKLRRMLFGNRAEMRPEAAGIAACLMAYSHHACRTENYAMTVHYYQLRDYALQHPECSAIMRIID
ncbi:antirestriction protein [Escherichia coli]|uniref:antirestriction protein n=1 Tax=Escherichia coli TaxID=562 RepID=UPI0039A6982E|nr:antirestriction protein [Escherichia coli]